MAMASAAEHGVGAGEAFGAAGLEGDPGEAEGDGAEADAGAGGDAEVDAHLGRGAVDQRGEAEDEADDAGEREDAVAGELGFEHHQRERGEEQQDGGVLDGQQVEAEDGEQDHERAERAGNDGAGDVEFEIDEQAAADEQEDVEVGAGEAGEQALAHGGREGFDVWRGEVEGVVAPLKRLMVLAVEWASRALSSGATTSMRLSLRASVSL